MPKVKAKQICLICNCFILLCRTYPVMWVYVANNWLYVVLLIAGYYLGNCKTNTRKGSLKTGAGKAKTVGTTVEGRGRE